MNETPELDGDAPAKPPPLTAAELETKFDAGEDVSEYVDWQSGVWVKPDRPTPGQKRAMEVETASPGGFPPNRKDQTLTMFNDPPPNDPDVEAEVGESHGL